MVRTSATAATLALLCLSAAQADVFNLGPGVTNLETVVVSDRGNDPDSRYASPGFGSVGYDYRIGKYEVTAAQYCEFLNHKAETDTYGLYNACMDTVNGSFGCDIQRSGGGTVADPYTYSVADDWANRPVNYVSYWDACRFANWLNNGQGNGDTETGAYTLNGYNDWDGRTIQRNPGAKWFLTSEDEWYKAAYYRGGGTSAGYWDYPTKSCTPPSNVGSDGYTDPGNHANYYDNRCTIDSPYYRTNVGEFENSGSAYGTFDQGGNVWELNEAIVYQDAYCAYRGARGGAWTGPDDNLLASGRIYHHPKGELSAFGFRVAFVPEPSSAVAVLCGLGVLVWRRR